jgi:hypothetical protein
MEERWVQSNQTLGHQQRDRRFGLSPRPAREVILPMGLMKEVREQMVERAVVMSTIHCTIFEDTPRCKHIIHGGKHRRIGADVHSIH